MEIMRRREGQRSMVDSAASPADAAGLAHSAASTAEPCSTAGASAGEQTGGAEGGADVAAERSTEREELQDLQIIGQELVAVEGKGTH